MLPSSLYTEKQRKGVGVPGSLRGRSCCGTSARVALHLRGIDVPLAVNREVVEIHELPEIGPDPPRIGDDGAVASMTDDVELAVRIVGGDEIALRRVGHTSSSQQIRQAFFHTAYSRTNVPSCGTPGRGCSAIRDETRPSFVRRTPCTGLLNCWRAAPSDRR